MMTISPYIFIDSINATIMSPSAIPIMPAMTMGVPNAPTASSAGSIRL